MNLVNRFPYFGQVRCIYSPLSTNKKKYYSSDGDTHPEPQLVGLQVLMVCSKLYVRINLFTRYARVFTHFIELTQLIST